MRVLECAQVFGIALEDSVGCMEPNLVQLHHNVFAELLLE